MCEFYGETLALILVRKHIARYLKGYAGIRDLHTSLVQVQSIDSFYALLDAVVQRVGDGVAQFVREDALDGESEEAADSCESYAHYSQTAHRV